MKCEEVLESERVLSELSDWQKEVLAMILTDFAKKEAIAFFKWSDDNLFTRTGEDEYENNDGDRKNREELYELFKTPGSSQ